MLKRRNWLHDGDVSDSSSEDTSASGGSRRGPRGVADQKLNAPALMHLNSLTGGSDGAGEETEGGDEGGSLSEQEGLSGGSDEAEDEARPRRPVIGGKDKAEALVGSKRASVLRTGPPGRKEGAARREAAAAR